MSISSVQLWRGIYVVLLSARTNTHRVPTKIWKQNSMTFPWLICFFPWFPFSHGFRYGYDCVSQNARQSQTRKLPQPWEEAIPRLFHDFPWQQFFPGFSMTVGTLHTLSDHRSRFTSSQQKAQSILWREWRKQGIKQRKYNSYVHTKTKRHMWV